MIRTILQSPILLFLALVAFVGGSMVMQDLATAPRSAGMSGCAHLQGNLPMLLLALAISFLATRRNQWAPVLAHVHIDTLLPVQVYSGKAQG